MTAYGLVCATIWVALGVALSRGLTWHQRLVIVALAPAVAILHGAMVLTGEDPDLPLRVPMVRGRSDWPL